MYLERKIFVGVDTPEVSEILQEKAFKAGYSWSSAYDNDNGRYRNTHSNSIILNPQGNITWNNRFPDEATDNVVWTFGETMKQLDDLIQRRGPQMRTETLIKTYNLTIGSAMYDMAVKSGYVCHEDLSVEELIECEVLIFNNQDSVIDSYTIATKGRSYLSMDEAVEFLNTPPKNNSGLYVSIPLNGDYEADFIRGSDVLRIGCQKVSYATVKLIAKRIEEIEESNA